MGFKVPILEIQDSIDVSEDAILVSFRGSETDFERLFLQLVQEMGRNYIDDADWLSGEEILRRISEVFAGRHPFVLNQEVELPFHQYPNLIEKYGRYIKFHDNAISSSDLEKIFDLIDYQDRLQALRNLVRTRRMEDPRLYDDDWVLETFGVRL